MGKRENRSVKALAIVVIVVVIIAIVLALLALKAIFSGEDEPGPGPHPSSPGQSTTPTPTAQPADCPDVQVISIPGTWESSSTDDPYNPTANPLSLMLNITNPLQQSFQQPRADVYTVPYVAQFSNPIAFPPDGQATYEASRTEGHDRAVAKITEVYQHCALTKFALLGFSQGAVIAGDIAADIGNARGPIPADNVLGVGLIADARRTPDQGQQIGTTPLGVGVEALLGGIDFFGIKLEGEREGGFGSINDRVESICAPGDLICDSPAEAFNLAAGLNTVTSLFSALGSPIHAMYNTPDYWNLDGVTATAWITDWATAAINGAPTPKHE